MLPEERDCGDCRLDTQKFLFVYQDVDMGRNHMEPVLTDALLDALPELVPERPWFSSDSGFSFFVGGGVRNAVVVAVSFTAQNLTIIWTMSAVLLSNLNTVGESRLAKRTLSTSEYNSRMYDL